MFKYALEGAHIMEGKMANRRIEKKRKAEKQAEVCREEVKVQEPISQPEVSPAINVYIQYREMELSSEQITEVIKKEWTAKENDMADLKKMDVYIKPEEKKAYYVINGQENGCIQL